MRLMLADRAGKLRESRHPALGRRGDEIVTLTDLIPMPPGAQLIAMPDRRAVTRDRAGNRVTLDERQVPVGALLPIGYTRTLLPPAFGGSDQTPLPLFGYTAVAEQHGDLFVAALHTERASTWDVRTFNTGDLPARVAERLAEFPGNVIAEQLGRCALEYGCFTAQNSFYDRWEMALPTSVACNARCIGCLSEQESQSCPAAQERITRRSSVDDIVGLAVPHLQHRQQPMVSFGQGCEGEPLLNWRTIEAAIVQIRSTTSRGWIHINTNGSDPRALERLIDAGLDSIRVSTVSARPDTYTAYYRPRNYTLGDVERSLRLASDRGIRTAVNLLLFPGVTDRAAEVEALATLFATTGLEQVQLRNLNVDPDQLMAALPPADSRPIGVASLVERLRERLPKLQIGSVSRLPDPEASGLPAGRVARRRGQSQRIALPIAPH